MKVLALLFLSLISIQGTLSFGEAQALEVDQAQIHSDEQAIAYTKFYILRYIQDHPKAVDTLEGVHHFWIVNSPYPMWITEETLLRLEAEGVMEQFRAGNRVLWRKRIAE